MSGWAKTATELKGKLPQYIPFQVCPFCDNVYYQRAEPLGAGGCGCKHDPADGPHAGDTVILTGEGDSYYELYKGHRGVIEGFPEWANGAAHICLASMPPFRSASGYVSISGGPFVAVDPKFLKYAGEKSVTFWKWNMWGPGADQGEYYNLTLPVWELAISDLAAKVYLPEDGG
jgi:hypothetical protein